MYQGTDAVISQHIDNRFILLFLVNRTNETNKTTEIKRAGRCGVQIDVNVPRGVPESGGPG